MNLRMGLSSFLIALALVISTWCAAKPQSAEHQTSNNSAPPSCKVTIPNGSQPPDKDWGGKGSRDWEKAAAAASYGNGKLWTLLPLNGELQAIRDDQDRLGDKWLWYRAIHGHLSVRGRRLDGSEHFETGTLEETVVGRDTGLLVQTLVFPVEGCWQITGSAGGTEITFVVNVRGHQQ